MTIDHDDNIYIVGDWNEEVNFPTNKCPGRNRVTRDNALPYVAQFQPTGDIACFGFLEQPHRELITTK